MSNKVTFESVPRPVDRASLPGHSGLSAAIRNTLTTGMAVSVPVNGDHYRVVLNRVASKADYLAASMNVRGHSRVSDDRLSIIVWLEPK